jgi:hypothetical protein
MRYSISCFIIPFLFAIALIQGGRAQSIGGNVDKDNFPSTSIISNSIIDDRDEKNISLSASYSKRTTGESSFYGIADIAEEARISKSTYIATFDIGRVIPGLNESRRWWTEGGSITVGVKRPYYRIGSDMRLRGFVDLRFSHSLIAVNSSLVVSIKYDFRKYGPENAFRSEIGVADIAYRIIIPFPP